MIINSWKSTKKKQIYAGYYCSDIDQPAYVQIKCSMGRWNIIEDDPQIVTYMDYYCYTHISYL